MNVSRRGFVQTLALAAATATAAHRSPAAATETDLRNGATWVGGQETWAELQTELATGKLTAAALAQRSLERIQTLDRAGPELRAVLETNPDALSIAAALDAERAAGHVRGPLHGVPVLVKDNIATADAMQTTAGSLALVGSRPLADATVVARLRAAGAVVLGKTNLSEWANFRSNASTGGWSGRGGRTRNPYALDRTASGSSSGSAVAVSAGYVPLAVGTETNGSIVSPAAHSAIVGVKPTVGLISRAGIIPIADAFDTAGPMARSVHAAAVLLGVLAGPDERDRATLEGRPAGLPTDYAAGLKRGALTGARLGFLRNPGRMSAKVQAVRERQIAALRAAGAEVIEPLDVPGLARMGEASLEVMLHEFHAGLNAYLAALGPTARVKTLADVIAFNAAHAAEELPFFDQSLLIQAAAKGPLTEPAYLEALATCRRLARAEGIDALTAEHRLDALVAVTNGPAWLADLVNGDAFTGGSSTLAALAGYPHVTVPADAVQGLPVGLSFMGPAWSEARLLALAFDFEQRSLARRAPEFRATLPM